MTANEAQAREVLVVTLENGDVVVFLDGEVAYASDGDEHDDPLGLIAAQARSFARALGFPYFEVDDLSPDDLAGWDWACIYEAAKARLGTH